ncbi:hypothetical protein BUALT_Bualt01G0223700 [Buddleja alternifolia]|uniref:Thiolase C-terminal domain-containing protein n=1 Tax=Buddleja alternifolia TaxID=168488 RepID=A0AAV6Y986_9LAMI|nr:hypothetical protein BUALT_Bualt01G0223700 [Buddleja alternifolia]
MVAKLGLHLIAKIRGFAGSVQAPVLFTTAPAIGTPKEISNSGLEASNIDFYEINEAFSVVALVNQSLFIGNERLSLSRLCKQIMGIIIRSLSKQYKLCIGRHRWAVIDKAYMHHTWRSSHSSDHLFLMGGNTLPSDHVTVLMDVLYLHSSETFRRYNLMANRVLLLHRIRYKCIHKSSERETWVLHLSAGSVVYSLSEIFENGSSLELSKIKYYTMSVLSPDDKCADIVFSYSASIVKWNKALKVQNLTGRVPPESFRDLTRHYHTFWTGEEDIRAITKEACSELLAYFAECMISGETLWRNAVMQRRTGDQKRRACKLQVSRYYQKVLADLFNLLLVIYRKPIPEKIFYGLDDIKEACDIIIVISDVQLTSGESRSLCQVGKGTLSEDGIGLPGGTIRCFASCDNPQKVWY